MADTLVYIGRRLVQLILVIFVAGTINFMIPRMIPGDPVQALLARFVTNFRRFDEAAPQVAA